MNNPGENLLSFVVGTLTGAAVALLVAPRSGQETREALRRGASDLASKGGEAVHNAVDGAREAVRRPATVVKGAAQAAKAAYQRDMQSEGS